MARTVFRAGIAALLFMIPWTVAPAAGADEEAAADLTIGTPPGGVPTADILRLQMMQRENVTVQNAAGPLLDASLVQNANLQTTAPVQGLQANQVTQVKTTRDGVFIRMVQEIRLRAQQLDAVAARPGGEAVATRAVASAFGTSETRIRAERAGHHLGLGELTIARALARATADSDRPLTLKQVIALRDEEGGWGKVFHHLKEEGLVNEKNLGQVVRQARSAAKATAAAAARAEVRNAAGHRFSEAVEHRATPGALDVRARAPEPARARPLAITTASNRTDLAGMGRPAGGGSARTAHSTGAGGGPAGRAPVTMAARGRDVEPTVLVTSAGNGSQAGGRATVTSAGRGHGGHGHGGPQR